MICYNVEEYTELKYIFRPILILIEINYFFATFLTFFELGCLIL